jgi:hypothetical protein
MGNIPHESGVLFRNQLSCHQLWTVLQCFSQMRGLDLLAPRQVCDRPREFQDTVIGTRRQIKLRHCGVHQTLAFILQLAKLPYLPDAHIGVTDDIGTVIRESFLLDITSGLHTCADRFKDAASKFGKFIQKQNAPVSQRYFSGFGNISASDETCM